MGSPEIRSGDELLLKVTPPRVPRQLLTRSRLTAESESWRSRTGVVLRAPAGFGKTSLLGQWRLEQVGRGHAVAWVSADVDDAPDRLLHTLALSARLAIGRPAFGAAIREVGAPELRVGAWLAELAQAATQVVLVVDDADRLPVSSQQLLAQVLRHAPPNLQVALAARGPLAFAVDDLVDYGRCAVMGAGVLRFRLDETLALLRTRFGPDVDNDLGAQLQEFTEGWPLGLQLVLASRDDDALLASVVASAMAQTGDLRRHFEGLLLGGLEEEDQDFLVRMACLDQLHPALCRAIDGNDGAAARLVRLGHSTPVLVRGEHGEWSRLHAVARDALRRRFSELPADVRARVHASAAGWYEQQHLLEDAARHAFAAGHSPRAFALAERCLHDAVVRQGRHEDGIAWYDRMRRAELARHPVLARAIAWALSGSERHREANALVDGFAAGADADDMQRCETAMMRGSAAIFADDPDAFCALFDTWGTEPPLLSPELRRAFAHRGAWRALLDGQAALARLRAQGGLGADEAGAVEDTDHAGRFLVGISYLWEGQPLLAEQLLRPALPAAEAELGRRGRVTCLLAAVLAAALWELDRPREASELLANRLDVLARTASPEPLILAYRTVVRVALGAGADHRALELLEGLNAVGLVRRLPRLQVTSLVEQVRLHARRWRGLMCVALCDRIDELLVADGAAGPRRAQGMAFLADQARAFAAIALQDWRDAAERLASLDERARRMRLGREHIELLGLRAFVLDRCGERSHTLLREAIELARTFELRRVLADAHPGLAGLVADFDRGSTVPPGAAHGPLPDASPAAACAGLTNKEREVLRLLSRNLSNKEIGRALQSGETTVKWHVKNLFSKLDAGSRKECVHRARRLGMLPEID